MKNLKYLFILFFSLNSSFSFGSSHCTSNETIYFTCNSGKNNKTLSLCGSKNLNTRESYLNYRFGKLNKIEMNFPESKKDSLNQFFYAYYFRAQVDRSEINFENKGTKYSLFKYYENEEIPGFPPEPIDESGVSVKPNGGKQIEIKCHGKVEHRLYELRKFIPCDKENALNLDGCPKK